MANERDRLLPAANYKYPTNEALPDEPTSPDYITSNNVFVSEFANTLGSLNYEGPEDATENGQTVTENTENKPSSQTTRQRLTFVGVAITYLTMLMSFSVLAPFFPYEAEKKGVNSTQTGFVFGIFALMSFLASPVLGKYLPVIGAKFMFLSGSFVAAGCNILFGFLSEIHGSTTFLVYCYVIRSVEAIGSAATVTAGMAIVANIYPDNVAQMGGMLEMFSGLGFALGPPIGSLFYGIGGYKLPFLVLGSIAVATSVCNIFILPSLGSSEADNKPGSLMSIAKIPAVWVILISCMFGSASLGFIDPTLSLHLTDPPLSVSPSLVGVLFLLIGGFYAIFAPIFGYIADKKRTTRIMMVIGFFLIGISYMLLGPSPLLKLPSNVWIIITSLTLLGISIGVALMPAFLDLLVTVKWYGLPEDLSTQALVSGSFNGAFSLGNFMGPTVAGILVDNLGFDWSATVFAGCNFMIMITLCLFGAWEFQCGKGRRKPSGLQDSHNAEPGERDPLLVET